ncbi:XdhC family protein [Alkalimarinus alittae]|uniref:XdhC family protein n=1 Tax=Alkalimarinus alittae TaxID=2961619 RepID=A0ABY6N466_9ALTE|nr:XdhC family protein [Alkalimarinus alittae]UZE96886.1 XdhC family protein [Alkalimarinus alittae]
MSFSAHSTEHRVIESLYQWLSAGQSAWLCTIVSTWGSSPRPAGSVLAFHPEHGIVGSLSGGCIEEALIRKLSVASEDTDINPTPYLYEYAISEEDQARYSLPCGGQITLLVERLVATPDTLQHVKIILDTLNNRQRIRRVVPLTNAPVRLSTEVSDVAGQTVTVSPNSVSVLFGPVFKMLLLGAGEVSHYVAQMANSVGFAVTLCDPRESFLQGWQQEGVEVIQCLPDDLVRARFHDPYCAILALAHDPRVDDMALMEALKTEAFYIGAMGSLKTTEARCKRLVQLDCTPAEISQLHAPIGLDIGSKKPAEIAISIMAEVVSERHRFLTG